MLKSLKLGNDARIGFYFVIPYLLLILFFVVLMFTSKDGGWMLVPISIITEFPFIPLILGLLVLITGNKELLLIHTGLWSLVGIVIGGIMNAFVLFMFGYLISKIFRRKKSIK